MKIKLDSCRICLEEKGLKNIFDFEEQESVVISKKIVYCASVQLSPHDLFPKMICAQCLYNLNIAYAFKMECESTDKKLRDLLCTEKYRVGENLSESSAQYVSIIENGYDEAQNNDLEESFWYNANKSISILVTGETNIMHQLDERFISSTEGSTLKNACKQTAFKETDILNVDESTINLIGPKVYTETLQTSYTSDKSVPSQYILLNEIGEKQKEISQDKVGRHIAKKITGKLPQRLHQHQSNVTISENVECENNLINEIVLEDVNLASKHEEDDVSNFEKILESNNIPVVVFEETVVTDSHTKKSSNKCTKKPKYKKSDKKIKINLKMALRKNRKVNVFKDYLKDIRPKHRRTTKEQATKHDAESTARSIGDTENKMNGKFKCDVCHKSFPYQSHLKRHLNKHTGAKSYSCNICKQKFVNNYNLNVHMSKHTGEFPLKCEICNKGLSNPSLLKRHMTSHTGEQSYQCRYCFVKFRQSSSLKTHEKIHVNRPSYHCDVCYKVFSYTNSLAAHRKLHFGALRFSCDVCSSTFSRKSSLIRHMREHTKSKSIKCKFCDLVFNSKSTYNSHLKTHCKYKCEICGEGFKYKSNFTEHVKKHGN